MHHKKTFLMLLTALPVLINAGIITHTFEFSAKDISFTTRNGYDVVGLANGVSGDLPGKPDLPHIQQYFIIPVNAEIEKVEVLEKKTIELGGTYKIIPVQDPITYSNSGSHSFRAPDPAIYSSSKLYPSELIQSSSSGSMSGFKVAGVGIAPLQYKPDDGKLVLTTSATVAIHYHKCDQKLGNACSSSKKISERQYQIAKRMVWSLVQNPSDISSYSPQVRPDNKDDVNYAIVTVDSFKSGFEPFKFWKTKKGFRTEVFTTLWIYSNYIGYDNAEKIRNFLKDYYANKGLIYVLLAGDYDKVPHRIIKHNGDYSYTDCASDDYFGDLDSTWDTNNDHIYGDLKNDFVDGYFDIYPGRLPLDNAGQINVFIHKDTTMEKCPPKTAMKKQLLASRRLSMSHDGSRECDIIADTCSGWLNVKMYNPHYKAVYDSLNKSDFYMMFVASHGQEDIFKGSGTGINSNILTLAQVKTLTNTSFPILYSLACLVGYFDEPSIDCIGEELINKPNAGCVATILNTRLGVGGPDSQITYSDLMVINFATMFNKRDIFAIGQVLAATKHSVKEFAWNIAKDSSKFNMYYGSVEFTLMGDPDLPIHKEILTTLMVDCPNTVNIGEQKVNFKVSGSAGAAVAGAYVCCYKDGDVHATGYTDSLGQVSLQINPSSNGPMHTTVTARNYYPYEKNCHIGESAVNMFASTQSPASFTIRQNVNGVTVGYSLVNHAPVEAILFGIDGKQVKILENRICNPGIYQLQIDSKLLKNGFYILKFKAGEYRKTEKLLCMQP